MSIGKRYTYLVSRIRILKQELDLVSDTFVDAQQDFEKAFIEKMKENLPLDEMSRRSTPSDSDLEESNITKEKEDRVPINPKAKNKDPELNKAFRRIAQKIHPDKLINLPEKEKNIKEETFKQAQSALEDGDLLGLLDILHILKLKLPPATPERLKTIETFFEETEKKTY